MPGIHSWQVPYPANGASWTFRYPCLQKIFQTRLFWAETERCSLNQCSQLPLSELTAPPLHSYPKVPEDDISQCETQHLAICNSGMTWGQPGCWPLMAALPKCGPQTAHHGAKVPWLFPGETLLFLLRKRAPCICSQWGFVLTVPKRKRTWMSWSSPEHFQMLEQESYPEVRGAGEGICF